MNFMYFLAPLLPDWVTTSFPIIRIILIILMALISVALVLCVLLQKGNSEGLGAISGATETFFGKDKGQTLEGKLRKITIILSIAMFAFSVLFFITLVIFPAA